MMGESTVVEGVAKQSRRSWFIALAVTIAVATAGRVYIYKRTVPALGPDSFSYLNLSRQLRGINVQPLDLDPNAGLPRDDRGARTPAYPTFLNIVFFLSGWDGSPTDVVEYYREKGIDKWHINLLRGSENVKAVQLAQHVLGVLATVLVFMLLSYTTNNLLWPVLGALATAGIRPSWVILFETSILTEVLAAFSLLALVWLLHLTETKLGKKGRKLALLSASGIASGLVLIRPQFWFLPFLLLVWAMARPYGNRIIIATFVVVPFVLFVGGWALRNGARHGAWTVSTVGGFAFASHFIKNPEVFRDPTLKTLISADKSRFSLIAQSPEIMRAWQYSFPEVDRKLMRLALDAAIRNPDIYLKSVIGAVKEYWYPSEVLIAPNLTYQYGFSGLLWRGVKIFYFALRLLGLLALVKATPAIRFGIIVAIASSVLTPLMAPIEAVRYGFTTEPLLHAGAVTAFQTLLFRIVKRPTALIT